MNVTIKRRTEMAELIRGRKPVVIKFRNGSIKDLTIGLCMRLDDLPYTVQETTHEFVVVGK